MHTKTPLVPYNSLSIEAHAYAMDADLTKHQRQNASNHGNDPMPTYLLDWA